MSHIASALSTELDNVERAGDNMLRCDWWCPRIRLVIADLARVTAASEDYKKTHRKVVQNLHSSVCEHRNLLSSAQDDLARVTAECDAARDKALRYDLDCAGIERREQEAVELVEVRAERDTYRSECASISTEFGLPATIRPAEGEIRRFMDRCKTAEADLARVTSERDVLALGNLEAQHRAAIEGTRLRAALDESNNEVIRLRADLARVTAECDALAKKLDTAHAEIADRNRSFNEQELGHSDGVLINALGVPAAAGRRRPMRDLKCPDCGEDVTNSPCEDFHEEGGHETECGNCGTPVIVTAYVSVDYTVRLVEPKETTHAQE